MVQRFDMIEVDIAKLREYCLSEAHPRGRHKARVFRGRLGVVATDAEFLRQAVMTAARDRKAGIRATSADEFGERYVLDLDMTTAAGTAKIRSMWIVLASDNVLRRTSCYVL